MDIAKLFVARGGFDKYPPLQFCKLDEDVGVRSPIVFVVAQTALLNSAAITVNTLPDVLFDIHVVYDASTTVVAYVIDTKYPRTTLVFTNGIRITQTATPHRTKVKAQVKYNLDDFQVVTDETHTAAVFCCNKTTAQMT